MVLLGEIIAGWVGGAAGILATHPLDTVRVRLQHQSGLRLQQLQLSPTIGHFYVHQSSPSPIGLWRIVHSIHDRFGPSGFYRGIVPPVLLRGTVFAMIRGSMELAEQLADQLHPQRQWSRTFEQTVYGSVGGFTAALCDTPIFVLKTRMQTTNSMTAKEDIVAYAMRTREIVRESGPRGLYVGFVPQMFLGVASWAMMFVAYDELRFRGFSPFLAGVLSAMASWPPFYPLDVIRTRMQAASNHDSFVTIARDHFRQRPSQWFPGLTVTLLRAGPRFGVTFYLMEQLQTSSWLRPAAEEVN